MKVKLKGWWWKRFFWSYRKKKQVLEHLLDYIGTQEIEKVNKNG